MSSTVPAQTRPVRQRIPMSAPDISEADIEAVNRVLRTPFLSIGPQIVEFEKRSAAYVGARHAIGVSSGTAGLHLCVIAAGVQEGDYVITTPFSFVSSANVILYERAIPIFVDVDEATGNIDPAQVSGAIDDLDHGGRAARRRLPGRLAEVRRGDGWRPSCPCTPSANRPIWTPSSRPPAVTTCQSSRMPARPSAPATKAAWPAPWVMQVCLLSTPTNR